MTALEAAARAYVLARESGRPTTSAYRKLRRAWVAAVRAESIILGGWERVWRKSTMLHGTEIAAVRAAALMQGKKLVVPPEWKRQ